MMKKTNPLNVKNIEELANKIRNVLNISIHIPFPILETIEFFHYIQCQILEFEFEEVEECPSYGNTE